jgi:hypothetical protein
MLNFFVEMTRHGYNRSAQGCQTRWRKHLEQKLGGDGEEDSDDDNGQGDEDSDEDDGDDDDYEEEEDGDDEDPAGSYNSSSGSDTDMWESDSGFSSQTDGDNI